jgi:PAS domain S-box-containing protein
MNYEELSKEALIEVLHEKDHSLKKFEDILNHQSNSILILDEKGVVQFATDSVTQILGYAPREVIGQAITEVVHPDECQKCDTILQNALKTPETKFCDEFQLKVKEGGYKNVKSTKIRLHNSDGSNSVICYLEDTDQKKSYENSLNSLCIELNRRLTSEVEKNKKHEEVMFHESRFLTMGMMMKYAVENWQKTFYSITADHNSLLLGMAVNETLVEENDPYCNALKNTISRITHLSNSVEQFRDLFTNSVKNHLFNLFPIINEMVLLLVERLNKKGITFEYYLQDEKIEVNDSLHERFDVSLMITGDENAFRHAFVNLINNAKEAILSSDIEQNKTIVLHIKKRQSVIQIMIRDSGGGIDSDIINRIYDPYFTTKEDESNQGLGLFLTKRIIEKNLKGAINLKCDEGNTTATITLVE